MNISEFNTLVYKGKISPITLQRISDEGFFPNIEEMPSEDLRIARNIVSEWKDTFVGQFIFRYPKRYGIVCKIRDLIGKIPEWGDMNRATIEDIKDMIDESTAKSSASTYRAMLKAVLNDVPDDVKLPFGKFAEKLRLKQEPSVQIYLNKKDINRLVEYKPVGKMERIVLAQFLCGCFTGARHSDILLMTENNINGDYLTYVSKKTKVQAIVEVKPLVKKLLPIACEHSYPDHHFNNVIRKICKKVGIDEKMNVYRRGRYETGPKYQFVASHTARRSFATNLALLGVPVIQIAKRMGHTDIKQTYGYICCSAEKLGDKASKFFA